MRGPWHLDALPLVISATDWDTLESGVVQRSRVLDAVLADLYGPRRSVTGGCATRTTVVRPSGVHPGRPGDRGARQASAVHARVRHQPRRRRRVPRQRRLDAGALGLRDTRWLIAASSRTPFPTSMSGSGPGRLRHGRRPCDWRSSTPRRGRRGTRRGGAEPGHPLRDRVRPGVLASVLGFPLVESADLVVRDGKLWMRSLGTLKRVDVGPAPGRRRLHRSARPSRRLPPRCGGFGRGAATGRGERREYAWLRYPGKPWAAPLSARALQVACSVRRC